MIHTSRQLKALVRNKSHGLLSASGHILEQIKSDAGLMNQWKTYFQDCPSII